jgi:hypothetical protein
MFIGAVQALGQYDMNTSTIHPAHINVKAQGTGTYFPDNLPKYSRHYKADNHRHFAAVGTYSGTLYSSDETFHTGTIHDYIVKNNNKTLKLDVTVPGNNPYAPKEDNVVGSNTMVGTMYLTNHPYWMGNKAFNGFSTRIKSIPERNHIGVDSIPAHYFASIPMNNKQGTKSDNLDAYSIGTPQTTTQLFTGRTSDCILSVWKDENNKTDTLHGHENSPKFFAMLPLIKI